MKKVMLAVVIALSFGFITNVKSAKLPSQDASRQAQSQTQTFIGQITTFPSDRYPVPFVIYDQDRKENYFVDDNSKVEKYEEKIVEITGTLNKAKNTIKIESVKEVH